MQNSRNMKNVTSVGKVINKKSNMIEQIMKTTEEFKR